MVHFTIRSQLSVRRTRGMRWSRQNAHDGVGVSSGGVRLLVSSASQIEEGPNHPYINEYKHSGSTQTRLSLLYCNDDSFSRSFDDRNNTPSPCLFQVAAQFTKAGSRTPEGVSPHVRNT